MEALNRYYYLIIGILIFCTYMFTVAPTVVQIDAGELATVQITLGIAHPTGYPLFTMIGFLFSLLPLPVTKISQLNILASIYCAISISVYLYTAKFMLEHLNSFKNQNKQELKTRNKKSGNKDKQKDAPQYFVPNNITIIISTIFFGIFLALNKTFWIQSTSVEVYSLHLLLLSLIILSLLKAFVKADKGKSISKEWIYFSFFLALGFANHMTTLLIIPGAAYLYFNQNGLNKKSLKQILIMLGIFFPILILLYSYLPIRALQNPLLNWGNPIDFERILRHISGKQYQVWLFSSTSAASKQFNYFISNLPKEFSFTILISLPGIISSIQKARKFFIFFSLTLFTTVLYSINYDINDIDSYFLLAYISIAFFILFGLTQIIQSVIEKKLNIIIPVAILILLTSIQFYSNYKNVQQKENYAYEDYTKSVLKNLPEKSVVFTYQWDFLVSPSYYFQLAENFRKDVVVIDKELLRRSWYYDQIMNIHPELLMGIKSDVNKFLEALKPFEKGEKFNSNLIEIYYRRIMTGLISANIKDHSYFIAPEIVENEMRRGEFKLPDNYYLVPYLYLFKVVNTREYGEYVPAPFPKTEIRFKKEKDKYAQNLEQIINNMLVRRVFYEIKFGKNEIAKQYIKKITAEYPDYPLPPELQNLVFN